jgi:c(7)-type cytochrome triheme protein
MSSSRKTALGEILADSVLKQAGIRKHLERGRGCRQAEACACRPIRRGRQHVQPYFLRNLLKCSVNFDKLSSALKVGTEVAATKGKLNIKLKILVFFGLDSFKEDNLMKSRSRTGCIIGMATAVCLGLCFSAAGQTEKQDQNAPLLLPQAEAPLPELKVDSQNIPSELKIEDPDPVLPPELEAYLKAQNADLPLELQSQLLKEKTAAQGQEPDQNAPPLLPQAEAPLPELKGENAPPPLPDLEQMDIHPLLPELQQKEVPAAEKPAAAPAKVITDPAAMPTDDNILFSHTFHVEKAGFNCTDCHNSIFQQTAGAAKAKGDFNMASLGQGKYCGTCHDGSTAFAVTDQDSCVRCHGTDMKPPKDSRNEADKGN